MHPDGSVAALQSPEFKQLIAAGRPVAIPDVFQTGLATAARERGGRWYLSYNQTDDAHRIQDILTTFAWLRSQTSATPDLIGLEKAALWVIFAAAVSRHVVNVIANVERWEALDETLHDHCFVPGLQRTGGLDAATRVIRNIRPSL